MKYRHWCPGYTMAEPLRWKATCAFQVGIEVGVSDRFLAEVFAVIALCPQHTFTILTGEAERLRTALAQVVTPQTAPGAQGGGKGIEQFTDAYKASWEYRVEGQIGPVASEYTDSLSDRRRGDNLYHKFIDAHYSRLDSWWPLPNVTLQENTP